MHKNLKVLVPVDRSCKRETNTSMAEQKRQLKLKSAVAKRLLREYQSYQQEETREKQRLEKLASENADEIMIKQQKNVISETSQMIPYSKKKLEQAVDDLNKYIVRMCLFDSQSHRMKIAQRNIMNWKNTKKHRTF
jgi:tubulin-specific chaperone A